MAIQVELPPELAHLLDPTGANLGTRVRQALVLELFQEGAISSGRAAELLGISKDAFLDLLAERGIPYLHQTAEELLTDAQVAASARNSHRG
jgi:predicted HTH domain antitoxin